MQCLIPSYAQYVYPVVALVFNWYPYLHRAHLVTPTWELTKSNKRQFWSKGWQLPSWAKYLLNSHFQHLYYGVADVSFTATLHPGSGVAKLIVFKPMHSFIKLVPSAILVAELEVNPSKTLEAITVGINPF